MARCEDCDKTFTDGMDGWICLDCEGPYCEEHYDDHSCDMEVDDDEEEDEEDVDDEDGVPDWMLDDPPPLEIRLLPEAKERQDSPETSQETAKKDGPKKPLSRGANLNRLDEDYRKIGVATWNLHGLNDHRGRDEPYAMEVPNRLAALGDAVDDVIAAIQGTRSVKDDAPETKKRKVERTEAKAPETDEEVAAALAAKIKAYWAPVKLGDDLKKVDKAPHPAILQELLARIRKLTGADCSVTTATECAVLRARTRRIAGSDNAWKKAWTDYRKRFKLEGRQAASLHLAPRKDHPLYQVLEALVALDQSLNTHLVITHINQLMANNPWLDAFLLQEVRPEGLGILREKLDPSLRLTFGPGMASVAKSLNQREYYPMVTRASTIKKVTCFAIACVKDQWSKPKMPQTSNAPHDLWTLADDEDLGAPVYRGRENGPDSLDTVNILWSKRCMMYRPVVVYELETAEGTVTIGNVHTSPGGKGENEWWRHPEYDQLDTAFDAGGQDGFWLMGGDYYLSAEARVRESDKDQLVVAIEDSDACASIIEHYERVTSNEVTLDSELTIKDAQKAILTANSRQRRPTDLRHELERDHRKQLRSEEVVPQPFVDDFHREVADTKRLDKNQKGEDIFRNVLGLTFEKVLPSHWCIAQAISGTNTHLKLDKFPAYATGAGKISIDRIERARRFTRARVTSKMRIADFFLFNDTWGQDPDAATLACKIGLLAPIEVGGGTGIHWYDEESLAISRYWLAISDHFPVGGVFTTDAQEPVLQKITAAPFMALPGKPSTKPADAPETEHRFKLVRMPQDGDCFFEGMKAALQLKETVQEIRQHALLEESKLPKRYVGWPDWEAIATFYGVTLLVHEYHYGEPDHFVRLLPPINPKRQAEVHMRLIHVPDQSASHMDLLVPRNG